MIRELDFTNTSLISDLGLLLLPKLAYLRKLDLNDTRTGTRDSVTSDSLVHVAKQCPNLQIAYFRRCRNVCDRGECYKAIDFNMCEVRDNHNYKTRQGYTLSRLVV